jgi:NADPH:quinone reductase-like Zn-dependent oxidoreductase
MRRMQAAGIEAFGDEVRMLELAAPSSPASDEVVLSVRAAGVGHWDEIVRIGDWDVGRRPPLALGVEAAGVVAAVGEDVTGLAPGDEVLTHPVPLRHQGAWAEWLVAPAAVVASKPAGVPWEVAAAFPVPALTADQALTEAASGPAAEWVLDYHDHDWPTQVRNGSPGGRGVGAAVNAARSGAATALQAVADNGRLATITGDPPPPVRGITVADVYVHADGARLAELVGGLADGQLSLHVAATLPLADAATALQSAATGHATGAMVLALDQSAEP